MRVMLSLCFYFYFFNGNKQFHIVFRKSDISILKSHFSSVAFLFNWIGFFLSFCLTTSAAGRYGAISGFGLSLIKWILIVRVRFHLDIRS